MPRTARKETWSTRAFRSMLALYPANFRDEYSREMTLLFVDRCQAAACRRYRIGLWLEVLAGIFTEAPKEHCRMMQQDLRYAFRALRQNPLFAATIVITLALGIGANSAIFSLLNAVVLKTLPVEKPEQLFLVGIQSPAPSSQRFTWPMFERLRSALPPGEIAAMSRVARMHGRIGAARDTEMISAQLVSGEYFSVLQVPTVAGRPIGPDDNRTPGAHPVAVISHALWQRRYAGAGDVLGQEITLNRVPFTIVGVASQAFSGVWLETPVEVWIPVAMQYDVRYSQNYSADRAELGKPWMPQPRVWWLDLVVRTEAERTTAIRAALNGVFQQAQSHDVETVNDSDLRRTLLERRLELQSFGRGFSGLRDRFTTPLYALMAMAGIVLLIACANTANLLLARAAARQREIALKLSLGAGRMRLVRQLLTESMLLVILAGAAALLIARWAGELLVRTATQSTTGTAPFDAAVDGRVLAFTAAVALATGLLFGLAPALRSTRVRLADTLKAAARGVSGGRGTSMARALVVAQVALSLVLVSGAGLLVRSLQNLLNVDLGFEHEHVLTLQIDPRLGYPAEQLPVLQRRLVERAEAVPGVRSAAVAMCGLISGCRAFQDGVIIEGYQARPGEQVGFLTNIVGPNYFSTVGMRLVEGRVFDERDAAPGVSVAIVNESMGRRYFAGRSAVGKRLGDPKPDMEIVGVVRDARVLTVKDQSIPMAFFPMRGVAASALEVRTAGDPARVAAAVRQAITEAEPSLAVERVTTVSERINANLSQERLVLSLTSTFGGLALGLATFGLFGILSYAVARRTSEFGIRMALGASPLMVVWRVLREALSLALIGLVIGLALVAAGSSLIRTLLFEVSPYDWQTLLAAALSIVAVSAIAGLFPAWRASRVDPLVALRHE